MTLQSSKTFVSKGNKTGCSCMSFHPWRVDLPWAATKDGKDFSPGSNKRVINALWYSSGTQSEREKNNNNLSLAPKYFPEWLSWQQHIATVFRILGPWQFNVFRCLSFYVCTDIWRPELVPELRRFEVHARIPLGYTGPQPTSQSLAGSAALLTAWCTWSHRLLGLTLSSCKVSGLDSARAKVNVSSRMLWISVILENLLLEFFMVELEYAVVRKKKSLPLEVSFMQLCTLDPELCCYPKKAFNSLCIKYIFKPHSQKLDCKGKTVTSSFIKII